MHRVDLRSVIAAVAIALFCSGCAAQATNNALDMSASYKGLLTKQILYNLGQAMDEPSFFPSQIVVATGSTVAVNAVSPNAGIQFPTSTVGSAVAAGFGAGLQTSVTGTNQTTLSSVGMGISATAQSSFTWALVPKNDPGELRRLRALYLYAVGRTPETCTDEQGRPLQGVKACFREEYVIQGGKHDANQAFTQRPTCVLCGSAADQSSLEVNDRLRFGFIRKSRAPGFHFLGSYGFTDFYVSDEGGDDAFSEFMLFVLEAVSSADFVPFDASKAGGPRPPRVRVPPKTQSNQPLVFTIPL